jgi:NAD(P)-dependent dehydrogenase (short-subunit alcohol dehydrogenase family)
VHFGRGVKARDGADYRRNPLIDACILAFGRIDVLHNNVGIVEVGGPVETSAESWDWVNDVNLKSLFLT